MRAKETPKKLVKPIFSVESGQRDELVEEKTPKTYLDLDVDIL